MNIIWFNVSIPPLSKKVYSLNFCGKNVKLVSFSASLSNIQLNENYLCLAPENVTEIKEKEDKKGFLLLNNLDIRFFLHTFPSIFK